MCMFSQTIERVSNTEIFVMDAGIQQLCVYSNHVTLRAGKPSAMILPVPCRPASSSSPDCGITVYDMSACSSFFPRLHKLFTPPHTSFGGGAVKPRSRLAGVPLEVKRSGSYRYTIVPSIADFSGLQHEVYGIDPSSPLRHIFEEHYASGFAFLVCIIDASASFVPIAYMHDKHACGSVFVPTRHYHGSGMEEKEVSDWDHQIVSLGCVGSKAGDEPTVPGSTINLFLTICRGEMVLPFPFPPVADASVLHRLTITGKHGNDDLWFTPESDLRTPGVCTFRVTGHEYAKQDWYTCVTCVQSGRLGPSDGACLPCVQRCHAGHHVTFAARAAFFCDCGAAGPARGCLCIATE